MRRSFLAWMTAAVTLVGGLGSGAGAEASAPSASIGVRLVNGQQLSNIDLGPVKADLVVTADADCRRGCDLVVRLYDQFHPVDQVVDSRTFAPGTTHRYTVRTDLALIDGLYNEIRLVQHTATGPRDLAFVSNASRLVPDPDEGGYYATYGGDWRRELDLAATETMVLRSRRAGSALSFPTYARADHGGFGVIAETGPSGGILGVYADGALVTKVDLRSSVVVKRKVVATLPVSGNDQVRRLSLVNLTPTARPGASVSFDGLVFMDNYAYSGHTAEREVWAPIHVRVLDQQFGTDAATRRVRMRVSTTVTGCTPDCRLMWGKTMIASGSGGTQTLSATIAPSLSRGVPEPSRVSLYRGTHYLGFSYVDPNLGMYGGLAYSYGWGRRDWPGSMRGYATMSKIPGTGWTTRWAMHDWRAKRTVAVISERGPRMGVMGVYQDGRLVTTVDLRSATRQQRVVVASVELGYDGRLTVANVTPRGRADRTVLFDSMVDIGYDED